MTKPRLGPIEAATQAAVDSLESVSPFDEARVAAALELAKMLPNATGDAAPRLVREWREILAELEPPMEPDDESLEAELARLTSGGLDS